MKLLYSIYQISCVWSVKLGNPIQKISIIYYIYCIIFGIIYTTIHIYIVTEHLNNEISIQLNFVSILIDAYIRYAGVLWMNGLIIAGLIKHPHMIEANRTLYECDKNFKYFLDIQAHVKKMERFQYFQNGSLTVAFVLLELLMNTFELHGYRITSVLCHLPTLIPIIVSTLVESQFIAITQTIYDRYKKINKLIYKYHSKIIQQNHEIYFPNQNQGHKRNPLIFISELYGAGGTSMIRVAATKNSKAIKRHIFLEDKVNYIDKLKHIESLYTQLYTASRLIDSAFGIQIVIMLTIHFIKLTTFLYSSCQLLIT